MNICFFLILEKIKVYGPLDYCRHLFQTGYEAPGLEPLLKYISSIIEGT